jgi:hypothetical protein
MRRTLGEMPVFKTNIERRREMQKEEMIKIAKKAIEKKLDYETLKYSDYLYGKEQFADEVYEYVTECEEIGTVEFYKKYPDAPQDIKEAVENIA